MSDIYSSQQTATNIQEKSNMIWNNANHLVGLYKPHEYGKVILPMTVIKRFHDTLLPTREKVLETYEKVKNFEVKDGFLEAASGLSFYNISPFTFESLLADPTHIEENFRAYLNGFSDNVQDVLAHFEFDKEITKLANNNILFYIIQEFNKKSSYLGADLITSVDMGYIFEDLIKTFSESYNEEAGAHFTSRDIIYLMTDLLICDEKDALLENGVVKTVYDQTMGTSQMLGCMEERLRALDADAEIRCFGQEFNPETYAIAKADMIIKGGNAENMKFGDTLSDDKFPGYTFDYCISNPPFGIDWKREEVAVKAEHKLGDKGRFGAGLPKISDGQMLFLQNGVSKLKSTGKMAIIQNASSLQSGDAGSGPSEIRRYLIENDWLDCIIQLCGDAFYNTEIPTYIWLVSKNKPTHRKGKVQLIDASKMYEQRRRAIGKKKNDITDACKDIIVQAYGEFKNKTYTLGDKTCESKVVDNIDLGYNKITIESPLLDENGRKIMKGKKVVPDPSKRDTEKVPLTEDIDNYFERQIKPYKPDAWIDKNKTTVGYEIPFTAYFYKYEAPEKSKDIASRISVLKQSISASLEGLFSNDDDTGIIKAITKGLNPNVPMKESGIDWIGEIPEHWNVYMLTQLFDQVKCKNTGMVETNLLSLSYGKIKQKDINTAEGLLPENFEGYNIIEKDDIVLRLTDLQNDRTSLRVGLATQRGIITSAYVTIRNKSEFNPEYLYYYLHCFDLYKGFYGMGAGVRQGLTYDGVKYLKMALPPREEQDQIIEYITKKSKEIEDLIELKRKIILELEDYKRSFICEHIIGK
jgi:type I restriction enzyme M protein